MIQYFFAVVRHAVFHSSLDSLVNLYLILRCHGTQGMLIFCLLSYCYHGNFWIGFSRNSNRAHVCVSPQPLILYKTGSILDKTS